MLTKQLTNYLPRIKIYFQLTNSLQMVDKYKTLFLSTTYLRFLLKLSNK